ncbi:MAG: zinc ABC transporter substrate-binding protein [Chloroflexi bacterium]|nr:zinc ABC transporter substrate-binding protein [Chloroflexota bacterium]
MRFSPVLKLAIAVVAAGTVIAACIGGNNGGGPSVGCTGGDVQIVVTLPLFADFACAIGGDNVTVTALVPADADPRTFEPLPEKAAAIVSADLVLYNGLDLDQPSLEFVFANASGRTQIIGYAIALPSPTAEPPSGGEFPTTAQQAGDNPHLWLDVDVARQYIESTEDSLGIVDPSNIPEYQERARELNAEFKALDEEIAETLQAIPAERRQIVSLHDSFPHFARAYGFEVLGFTAASPQETATQEGLDALAQALKDAGVPAVFAERGYDATALEQIADETGVLLCSLYSDRIDAEADGYIEMMRANAEELVRCLS